jgi:hypothetical protein
MTLRTLGRTNADSCVFTPLNLLILGADTFSKTVRGHFAECVSAKLSRTTSNLLCLRVVNPLDTLSGHSFSQSADTRGVSLDTPCPPAVQRKKNKLATELAW